MILFKTYFYINRS